MAAGPIESAYRRREGTSGRLPVITNMPPDPRDARYPVVLLDPGHGTRDVNGKIPDRGSSARLNGQEVREEGLTLDYAMWLQAELRLAGIPCRATRTYERPWFDVDYGGYDRERGNELRAAFAAQHEAGLLVRIHFDGSADRRRSGFSVWHNDQSSHDADGRIARESLAAAESIRSRLADALAIPDLGLRRFDRPIYGFMHARQPSVLLELGFLSNAGDAAYVLREDTLRAATRAVAEGIRDYLDTLPARTPRQDSH